MSYQEDVQRYHELLNQGVPPRDAFFSVWPDGLQGAADKRAKEESKKQQGDQLAGVAGTVAGAVATQQAIKHAPSLWETKKPDTTTTTKTETPAKQQAEIPADAPTGTNADYEAAGIDPANVPNYGGEPQIIAPGAAVPDGYTAVGTDASGGTITVPNENIQGDGSVNLGKWAQGAGGAFALYNAYKRYEEGDNVGAALAAAQGGANIAAAAGSAYGAQAAPYAGYAMGSYNIHNAINDGSRTRDQKGAEVGKQAGLMVADAFTGGLSSLADTAFRSTGFGRKWGGKVDDFAAKLPGSKVLGSVMGGLDTRHTQLKNTQDLIKDAEKNQEANPGYLEYLYGARKDTIEEPETNKKGLYFAGKYKNFDEYKAAGLEAADLTHVLGNLETFGPEWAALTEDQRKVVTQALINEDMYISDKGEVNIRKENRDRAQTIFNTIKDVGFDPAFVQMPEQAPVDPLGSDLAQPPVNTNGATQMNGFDNNKMLMQPPAPIAEPQYQPQTMNYIGQGAASKYPSIREYLASMQQGGQQPSYQPDFGGPAGQSSMPQMSQGTSPQPGYAQPAMPSKPGMVAAPTQPMPGAQPAQQLSNFQISQALKRAREQRD